jgi:DNA-binding NarL/FixJ family response regulator
MELIRVLVVDDQSNVRTGLKMLLALEPDMHVVGEAQSGVEAIASALTRQADVIVMDYEMPGLNGIETVEALRRNGIDAAVVLLSLHDDIAIRTRAAIAGAHNFVTKHESAARLTAAIRDAAASRQAALT